MWSVLLGQLPSGGRGGGAGGSGPRGGWLEAYGGAAAGGWWEWTTGAAGWKCMGELGASGSGWRKPIIVDMTRLIIDEQSCNIHVLFLYILFQLLIDL